MAEFGDLINFYAKENQVDPWDIAAIIWTESRGDANVVNDHTMATGLGQVLPKEWGFEDRPTIEELKNPETNIKWTCKIYGEYLKSPNRRVEALYRYSGGGYWESVSEFAKEYWNPFIEARRFLGAPELGNYTP